MKYKSLIYLSRVLWHVAENESVWNLVLDIFKKECTRLNMPYHIMYDILLDCNTNYIGIKYE